MFSVLNRFMLIKTECRYYVINEDHVSELTFKQIEYLKKFDKRENITISQFAEELGLKEEVRGQIFIIDR